MMRDQEVMKFSKLFFDYELSDDYSSFVSEKILKQKSSILKEYSFWKIGQIGLLHHRIEELVRGMELNRKQVKSVHMHLTRLFRGMLDCYDQAIYESSHPIEEDTLFTRKMRQIKDFSSGVWGMFKRKIGYMKEQERSKRKDLGGRGGGGIQKEGNTINESEEGSIEMGCLESDLGFEVDSDGSFCEADCMIDFDLFQHFSLSSLHRNLELSVGNILKGENELAQLSVLRSLIGNKNIKFIKGLSGSNVRLINRNFRVLNIHKISASYLVNLFSEDCSDVELAKLYFKFSKVESFQKLIYAYILFSKSVLFAG